MENFNEGLLKLYRRILNDLQNAIKSLQRDDIRHQTSNSNKPLMILGPSSVGKNTLINKLKEKYPEIIYKLPLYTTRPRREGEIDGVDYYFITKEEFLEMRKENKLFGLEMHNNDYYASGKYKLKEAVAANKGIIIVNHSILTANTVKDEIDFNFVAVLPPSEGELRKRIAMRTTKEDELKRKMAISLRQIQIINGANYIKFRVVNDNIDRAFGKLDGYIKETYPQLFSMNK